MPKWSVTSLPHCSAFPFHSAKRSSGLRPGPGLTAWQQSQSLLFDLSTSHTRSITSKVDAKVKMAQVISNSGHDEMIVSLPSFLHNWDLRHIHLGSMHLGRERRAHSVLRSIPVRELLTDFCYLARCSP